MEIKVSRELNYNLEAYIFLLYQSTDQPYKKDFKDRMLEMDKATSAEFENIIKEEKETYYKMEKNMNLSKEDKNKLKFFFDKGKDGNISIAHVLLSYIIYDDSKSENFLLMDNEEKLNYYIRIIFSDNNVENTLYENGMKQNEYEELIDTLDIPLDCKYKYLLLYRNHEKYLTELISFVDRVKEEMFKQNDNINKKLDYYEKVVAERLEKEDDFFGFMDVQIDYNENIILRPSFLASGSVVISSFMKIHNAYPEKEFEEAIIYFGVNVITFSNLAQKHDIDDKTLLSIFKTLGDNSKYEILISLKGRKMYAAEIAKKVNVTNATVSYHMRNLFQLALVKMSTDNNRVYYTLNEETMSKVVVLLGKNFCG